MELRRRTTENNRIVEEEEEEEEGEVVLVENNRMWWRWWNAIREFKKPRRRPRGQRRLKNELIFYPRISRYP